MPTRTTKPDTILKLISRKSGAALAQLEEATGWQPHSIRAALTGLRKKGHEIKRDKNRKGVTIYSSVEGAQP
jgi:hypothetical protein